MRRAYLTTAALACLMFASCAIAQTVTYPGKPSLRQYTSSEHRVQISFPVAWKLDRPLKNEIWLSVGELRGNGAACFVRVSSVESLRLSTPAEFFAKTDEKAFVKLNSMAMPDIKIHMYDMAYLGGRTARRAIYSGTDSGVRTGTVTYQTLDGDKIFTAGCVSESTTFQLLYNDFEAVLSSFRFTTVGR